MKLFLTTIFALIGAILMPLATFADTPNRAAMTFPEFVEASGCVIVDKGGYSNLAAKDGGACDYGVTLAFISGGADRGWTYDAGADGLTGTPDDIGRTRDN